MVEINNKERDQNNAIGIVLVSLLLTLNMFQMFLLLTLNMSLPAGLFT